VTTRSEPKGEGVMNTLQHLREAAQTIALLHNPDAARSSIADAALETFGCTDLHGEIINFALEAMYAQRAADVSACMGFELRSPPQRPAVRSSHRFGLLRRKGDD
jgi:hypothetical protein